MSFVVCWSPFHAQRLMATYVKETSSDALLITSDVLNYISGVTYYLSATVNPVLYHIMSAKFRHAFRETFVDTCCYCCHRRSRQRHRHGGSTMTTTATMQHKHHHRHHQQERRQRNEQPGWQKCESSNVNVVTAMALVPRTRAASDASSNNYELQSDSSTVTSATNTIHQSTTHSSNGISERCL